MSSRWQVFMPSRLQKGFTLIEILVVIVLLGIILTVAMISIGNTQSGKLKEDMRRLLQIMRLAHEEAITNQQTLAMKFSAHGYALQRYDEKGKIWVSVTDPDFFRARKLDEDYKIRLLQDGLSVSLTDKDSGKVLMYSSGEMTPFELDIGLPDSHINYHMSGDLMGKLTIKNLQAYGNTEDEEQQ